MDRRSWLWRRKSTDKSPGETETSASEKITDEQVRSFFLLALRLSHPANIRSYAETFFLLCESYISIICRTYSLLEASRHREVLFPAFPARIQILTDSGRREV